MTIVTEASRTFSYCLLGRVSAFRDAEEIGIPDSHIAEMKERMREWHKACVAYQRDRREVLRDCKDKRELADTLATMRANQDADRERIFG